MKITYYLSWLHFDAYGRMRTRLPEGHRVLHVLDKSGSNRDTPALWVLVEAVIATPTYTPPAGFPSLAEVPPPPPEYRQSTAPHPSMPFPVPAPVPDAGYEYREEGRTRYPELYPEARDDDYRNDTGGFAPSVPMSPASGTPSNPRR